MEQPQQDAAATAAADTTTSKTTVLDSVRIYDELRMAAAPSVTRYEGSNVDHFTTASGNVTLCHLSAFLPITPGDKKPNLPAHESLATILLAAAHLNTGDGSIVPQVEGLNERCNVRFTAEFVDTEYQEGIALQQLIDQVNRDNNNVEGRGLPCAFLGADRSAVSIPMSIVTGLFGYPQISGGATSVTLDDKSQYPLFGRSLPSDAGNAIPTIIYLRESLQIKHLAVINVNDAYGNNYVEGMRAAAAEHAPDMIIHQIPLDEDQGSVVSAVQNAKATGYRFVFALVFSKETHDALLTEAYEQGVAGTGVHNWVFADSFVGTLDARTFAKDSALHKAYRGSGLLEVSGGVPGVPSYDAYASKMAEILQHPTDVEYMASLFPTHHGDPNYPETPPFIDEPYFLNPIVNGFAPFYYEATIALGLAACAVAEQDPLAFTGQEHFERYKETIFDGVSGDVVFDPVTGTRDPSTAFYRAVNFIETQVEGSTDGAIEFRQVIVDLFQEGAWVRQEDYIFNDGTTNLPADLPPPPPDVGLGGGSNLGVIIAVPIVVTIVMGVIVFLFYENKRKQNDSVWKIQRSELKFSDPPEIIGQGTFGCVYLAEYRGTEVAVKRAIPPRRGNNNGSSGNNNNGSGNNNKKSSGISDGRPGKTPADSPGSWSDATSSPNASAAVGMSSRRNANIGSTSWGGASLSGVNFVSKFQRATTGGHASGIMAAFTKQPDAVPNKRQSEAAQWRAMRLDFVEEMRHLSKLRHPCVTTIMGAVTGKDPMIVMEYMEHGSLYDILHNETMAIEGELLVPIMRDISQGIRFLHSADPQVVHGDLKAANILVDSKFRAKVADFGLTQKKNLGGTGTPFWMAPELLRQESVNTAATDVFSFGIILYEVYSRREPYEDENPQEVLRLIADKSVRKRPPAPKLMPDNIKSLMADCVDDDPEKRPTFEEINMRVKRIDAESADPGRNTSKMSPSSISLFDIFPRHIAEALRDGRTVEAEHRDSVTIFFSDIVGFTTISAELEPRKVATLLDRLYTKFDALSRKHDVFKVETIGDAYMCASNLIKYQEDHTKRIAEFAIEAIAAANETPIDLEDSSKGFVNIRVGFHSGPVVADVVGTRNPRYCLFGDAVNTASRMESNSEANRIHCSQAAAKLLSKQCPTMPLKSRGKINIKGKGLLHTYWVNEEGGGSSRSGSFFSSTSSEMLVPPESAPLAAVKTLQSLEEEEESESSSDDVVQTRRSSKLGALLSSSVEFLKQLDPSTPNHKEPDDDHFIDC